MGQAKLRKAEIAELKVKGSRVKELGQVFTPFPLVKEMLDRLDESTFSLPVEQLQWKTFLEPACGNGQFILGIIRKLMDAYSKPNKHFDCSNPGGRLLALTHILEVQLFAIELDPVQHAECLKRVQEMFLAYDVSIELRLLNHNIIIGNALELDMHTAFLDNMKNWKRLFIAKTGLHLQGAAKFKLSTMVVAEWFNPAEIAVLNSYLRMAA